MTGRKEINEALLDSGGVTEISEVRQFKGYRGGLNVDIKLMDRGEDCGDLARRFLCEVTQENGKTATGNPGESMPEAIANVHWIDLDQA